MIYKEEQRDLFTVPQGYMLAHCISADFALGAGIATQFNTHFDMRNKLFLYGHQFWDGEVGRAVQIENVFNLITKAKGFDRPTMADFRSAVEDMCQKMQNQGITRLAIPQIGAGLDRLDWNEVRGVIEEIFEDTDIEILVCLHNPTQKKADSGSVVRVAIDLLKSCYTSQSVIRPLVKFIEEYPAVLTSEEYIEQSDNAQYQAWKSMADMCMALKDEAEDAINSVE